MFGMAPSGVEIEQSGSNTCRSRSCIQNREAGQNDEIQIKTIDLTTANSCLYLFVALEPKSKQFDLLWNPL